MAQTSPPSAQEFSVSFSSSVASGSVTQRPDATPEDCKVVNFGDYWALALSGDSGADGYSVEVVLFRGYSGPGTYTGDATAGDLSGHFEKLGTSGTIWGGAPPAGTPGTLSVNGTGLAGSFDMTLRPTVSSPLPGDTLLHMTGTFNCTGFVDEVPTEPPEETAPPQENSCGNEAVERAGALAVSGPFVAQNEPDVEISGVEVVQAVQNPDGKVPMVVGKATLIRVFVHKLAGQDVVGAVVSLRASLPSGDPVFPAERDIWDGQCVLALPSIDRDQFAANEAQFWLRNPPSGSVTFSAFARATGTTGNDPTPNNNTGITVATFEADPRPRVALVGVCMGMDSQRNGTECPTASERATITASLSPVPMFPTNERMIELPGTWIYPGQTKWQKLNPFLDRESLLVAWLRSRYQLAQSGSVGTGVPALESIVGVVSASATSILGMADTPVGNQYFSGLSHTGWMRADSIDRALPNILGQLWGLTYDPKRPCDLGATIRAPGVNPATRQFQGPGTWSVMTNCGPPWWISAEDATTLFENRLRTTVDEVMRGGHVRSQLAMVGGTVAADATTGYLLVTGVVAVDGSAGALAPAIAVAAQSSGDIATDTDAGRFCVDVGTTAGAAVDRHCFEPSFVNAATGDPSSAAMFTLTVPVGTTQNQVTLTADGRQLDVLTRSAHAPVVTAPTHAGEEWTSAQELTWTITDTDGDALNLNVLYSPNGGETWLPFAPDWPADRLSIDPAQLQTGNSNMFRLVASDGFNSTTTDVGPIRVTNGTGHDIGLGGGCSLERDCEPSSAPSAPSSPNDGPNLPVVVVGLGLLGLLVVGGIGAALLIGRRRQPALAAPYGSAGGRALPPSPPLAATHVVPMGGLPSWQVPNPAGPPTPLAAGLEVAIREFRPDGWAFVVAANGWSGWVDGRLLVPRGG
jgi:hypothetical protein